MGRCRCREGRLPDSAAQRQFKAGWTEHRREPHSHGESDRAPRSMSVWCLKNQPSPENPSITSIGTCTTLAPGSDPTTNNPKTTGGRRNNRADRTLQHALWSDKLSAGDESSGPAEAGAFEKLRYFKNWTDHGPSTTRPPDIFAAVDISGGINHDQRGGIIGIADNKVTPGLKNGDVGIPRSRNETDARGKGRPTTALCRIMGGLSDRFFHRPCFPHWASGPIRKPKHLTVGHEQRQMPNEDICIKISGRRHPQSSRSSASTRRPRRYVTLIATRQRTIVR